MQTTLWAKSAQSSGLFAIMTRNCLMWSHDCRHDTVSFDVFQELQWVPFSAWCWAACGSSPRAQRLCPARGSTLLAASGRSAPVGPPPPRWSRSHGCWDSGCAPSEPALRTQWVDRTVSECAHLRSLDHFKQSHELTEKCTPWPCGS